MIRKRWVAAATVASAAWAAPAAEAVPVYGLTDTEKLVAFDTATPGAISAPLTITGLGSGVTLKGVDIRPATLQMYGLGSNAQLYRIDTVTGAATATSAVTGLTPAQISGAVDIDFNPTVDRLRLVGTDGLNARINPNTGAAVDSDPNTSGLQLDGNLNTGGTTVTGVTGTAYEDNAPASAAYPNPPATRQFDINTTTDRLQLQSPPNAGTLADVGTGLTVDLVGDVGFDISTTSTPNTGVAGDDVAYLVGRTSDSNDRFYTVNLTAGTATLVGEIAGTDKVKDIAVSTPLPQIAVVYTPTSGAQSLITYRADRPGSAGTPVTITGLAGGNAERIIGIDRRPAGGLIYAVTDASRLYTITASGAATQVSTGPFAPLLSGDAGIDFNPIPDAIRAVTESDQNLRISPSTGAVAGTDTALAYVGGDPNAGANPNVTGAGYTNSTAPAPSATTLFDVDSSIDALVLQGLANSNASTPAADGPNGGQLTTVGTLGLGTGLNGGIEDGNGFDILPRFNHQFGAFQPSANAMAVPPTLTPGAPTLYGVNVASTAVTPPTTLAAANGMAVSIGALGGAPTGATVAGMTVVQDNILPAAPTPTPTATPTATATYAVPTATPGPYNPPVGKVTPGLSIKVKPKKDTRKPFKFAVSGKLNPKSAGRSACRGTVNLTAKKGGKTDGKTKTTVKGNCTYKKSLKLTKKAGKRGTAKIKANFTGNNRLRAKSAQTTAKYGKKKRRK